ncbi:MAG: LuxR C-terminal-related transcriptional regulator [bacterium]|nr:LuxR C-terminal-related transcriptional regulator [bacterium]
MTGTSSPDRDTAGRIRRRELLHLLDHSHDFALTLLLAPAGFGKSTLLQQWQRHRSDSRVAWLTLDAGDADPVRFFRRMGQTLRQTIPRFDTVSYNHLSAEIALPATAVAEALEQAFAAVEGDLYLLLDDFQHARHPLIQQVMALLLERLPAHVHFVIATRIHPDFSLSRLKLDDRLLLIDGHDLRLTAAQVMELGQQLGLELDQAQLEHLLTLTEGWMAGVKIALLAQARTGRQTLEDFSGRQPEVVDYFAHVVLRDLSAAMHDFVLCTAALEQFDAALCDAVLERDDSAGRLNSIMEQALFLQETGNRPGWYRYHPLFQDFLENRLRIEMPERLERLHVAAAEYLLRQEEMDMALAHARQCSPRAFLRVLRECCAWWLRKGDYPAIIRSLEPLPDEQIMEESDLLLPLVGALILSRRFNQARYYLDAINEQGPAREGRFSDDSTPTFLDTMLQVFQHDTDFRLQEHNAVLLSSCRHHDIRAFALAIIAYHYLLHADFAQARQYGLQAKVVLGQLGYDYLESYADLILILCDRNTGHIFPAIERAENFMERLRSRPNTPAWVNARIAVGIVRYEQNRLDDAQRLCEELIPLVNTSCATELIVAAYITLSRLLALKGEQTRATRLVEQLKRILQLGNYDRFVAQVACEELLQALMREKIQGTHKGEAIERIARQHQLPERLAAKTWVENRAYDEGWERYGLATALYLRSRNRLGEAEGVLVRLSASLRQSGVRSRVLIIDANLAVVRYLRENHSGAIELLQRLIEEHGLICINRIVFDEAPGLVDVMRLAQKQQSLVFPEIYLAVFEDVFMPAAPAAIAHPAPALSAALTGKEAEILEFLQQGLSNNEISQASGVALSTTKWHLKNIFAKLGVANRTAAILRAAQLPMQKPLH